MASEMSSSHTLYAQLRNKAQTHEHESELYELAQLAGVTIDPEVFKIILDLLEMKCSPKAIADVLRSMLKHSKFNRIEVGQGDSKRFSHSGSISASLLSNSSVSVPSSTLDTPDQKTSNLSVNHSRSSLNNVTLRSRSGDRNSRNYNPSSYKTSIQNSSGIHSLQQDLSAYSQSGERKHRHQ